MINIYHHDKKIATFLKDGKSVVLDYQKNSLKNSITLSLPNTQKIYLWENRFSPYFETFLPEGYLFEIFKNLLTKEYGYIDEYLLFSLLSPNIDGRIRYKSDKIEFSFDCFDIEDIIESDTKDTFNKLLNQFLDKNAISGVQPKTVAILKTKETIEAKEYIIKTWGDEFEYLAENEYFCLKAVEKVGVPIPNITLSKNKRFLIVEKFTNYPQSNEGFEEVLSLLDKNKINKYQGSYEQVAKVISSFVNDGGESLINFYKTVIMNYLLKNGDAHLKNFGLVFSDDFKSIRFAPAYDIVTTTAYIFKDKPALTLGGKKVWYGKKELVSFGQKYCNLSKERASKIYYECIEALEISIKELESYIAKNPHFKRIGGRMLDCWRDSLKQETTKEISIDIIRNWNSD